MQGIGCGALNAEWTWRQSRLLVCRRSCPSLCLPPQFFVVGHDAGHRSFSKNKLLEDVVGTLMFAPLIFPFEPWRIKHNHHHAHTNK